VIVSDFPATFAEFRGKDFENLWREGPLRFRCFPISPPMRWPLKHTDRDLRQGQQYLRRIYAGRVRVGREFKADDSQKSFVFTLKNSHNLGSRRCAGRGGAEIRIEDRNESSGHCL
jgi:hypothetical protein